jgi:hypothetical protein
MKLRFWLIAMMFFQAGLGSVMETQFLKTQAWLWGQLPNDLYSLGTNQPGVVGLSKYGPLTIMNLVLIR